MRDVYMQRYLCRSDGIGRRAGLKIPWWQHRMGSTPIAGTKNAIYVLVYIQEEKIVWKL